MSKSKFALDKADIIFYGIALSFLLLCSSLAGALFLVKRDPGLLAYSVLLLVGFFAMLIPMHFDMKRTIAKLANTTYADVFYGNMLNRKATPEQELAISKSADAAYEYAVNCVKGRFPLGEEAINKDSYYKSLYDHYLNTNKRKDTGWWISHGDSSRKCT